MSWLMTQLVSPFLSSGIATKKCECQEKDAFFGAPELPNANSDHDPLLYKPHAAGLEMSVLPAFQPQNQGVVRRNGLNNTAECFT